ncbi:MAG: hypothetical protein H0U13_08690 [Gemmatimonadaceae bacterium]|nr:hypothetical protein [Gemmatimonadaceae bacterium]
MLNEDLFDQQLFDHTAVKACWTAFLEGDHRRGADLEKLLQIGLTKKLLTDGWSEFYRSVGVPEVASSAVGSL